MCDWNISTANILLVVIWVLEKRPWMKFGAEFPNFLRFRRAGFTCWTSQAKSARRGPPEGWAVRKSILATGSFWYKMCQCKSTIFNSFHKSLPQRSYPCNLRPLSREVFYKMKSVQTANVQLQMSEWQMSIGKFPWQMCAKQVSLRLRRVASKTSTSLVLASSAVEVRDQYHEVRLGHRVILVYNMSM